MKKNLLSITLIALSILFAETSCKKSSSSASSATGQVSTLSGSGQQGNANGSGTAATFFEPAGVSIASDGSIIVTDYGNSLIRKITADGTTSILAGNPNDNQNCLDGSGQAASFTTPLGICTDPNGNLFVGDQNCGVRELNSTGTVTSFFKNDINNPYTAYASFICADNQGNIYVTSLANGTDFNIYMINPQRQISLFAGSGTFGYNDGAALSAQFTDIAGLAIDDQNTIYVADGSRIRKISQGKVTTIAGSQTPGYVDGTGTNAQFNALGGICVDSKGNLYVTDGNIRKITPAGVVTTIAGDGNQGFKDGGAAVAEFYIPKGIAVDGQGNLYVADWGNNRVRKISFK